MALAILKPGGLDRFCCRDTIDGLQVGRIILFKDQTAGFESGDFGLNIVSDPASLRVGPTRSALRCEFKNSVSPPQRYKRPPGNSLSGVSPNFSA